MFLYTYALKMAYSAFSRPLASSSCLLPLSAHRYMVAGFKGFRSLWAVVRFGGLFRRSLSVQTACGK